MPFLLEDPGNRFGITSTTKLSCNRKLKLHGQKDGISHNTVRLLYSSGNSALGLRSLGSHIP